MSLQPVTLPATTPSAPDYMRNSSDVLVLRRVYLSSRAEACSMHVRCFACHVKVVLHIGVRAIFGRGGVNHLPKKFLQVAQIFTKQSKRNEGHTMQQHRPYWHMKVARYSFSGSIPAKFEHKLRTSR